MTKEEIEPLITPAKMFDSPEELWGYIDNLLPIVMANKGKVWDGQGWIDYIEEKR